MSVGGDFGQVVAGAEDQALVSRAGRHQRLQRYLDIDGQAGRAPLIRLQAVPEAAVIIAVTAQHVDNAGRRCAFEAGREQPALKQPALAEDEVSS